MAISNKSQIVVQTLTPFTLAFAGLAFFLSGAPLTELMKKWEHLLAISSLVVVLSLLQDLVPKSAKEMLVFWRFRERMPGHRAFAKDRRFSEIIDRNEVVDIVVRESLSPKFQNRLFYMLYDKYKDNGNVKHYSFRYLQWRELTSQGIICSLLGCSFILYHQGLFGVNSLGLIIFSVVLNLGFIVAARNSSKLLIDYVLLSERLDVKGGDING